MRLFLTKMKFLYLFLFLLIACNDNNSVSDNPTDTTLPPPPPPSTVENLPIPDNRYVDSYQILLFGNSHVRVHNLADVIQLLLEQGTDKYAISIVGPGMGYLDSRFNDGVTAETIESRRWSHVIWQAQKYSTSGKYTYPTSAAEYWIELTKQQGATPILFPEHPREGNKEEGMRIYALHVDITSRAAACVAPIGPAWDLAIKNLPDVSFHIDGNHASINGTLLTALIFYQVITGESVENLVYIPQINVAETLQAELRQIAAATFQQFTDCIY
ncbi:hypothetical protein [Rheinheimera sp. WS51]|uniref:hypothetical protein n=1 Tax=Rheinheimera sp. WS51 TaxID=3425886 RepID=UPI003D905D7A